MMLPNVLIGRHYAARPSWLIPVAFVVCCMALLVAVASAGAALYFVLCTAVECCTDWYDETMAVLDDILDW